jgi:DNA-binding CsgD family transcriptional regulator
LPTLIIHQSNDLVVPVECGRYLADHISGATYVEGKGADHMYWLGNQDETLNAIRSLLSTMKEGLALMHRKRAGRPGFGWESLTRAEVEVARLAASGMTNRQIAARLFISPRTVETHIAHAIAKLRLSRRSELVAEVVRQEI